MTSTDKAAATPTDAVALDLDLPHAPAKVWRALTDPALLSEWLLPVTGFQLQPGASFKLTAPPQPGWDGTVSCRLLDIDTEKTISWRWVVGDIDTVVTFTLFPTPSGTRLSIVQSGFKPDQKRNLAGARYGWRMMSDKLAELLSRTP